MTDNIITRDEAIDRMKAGLPCETYCLGKNDWRPTEWDDFGSRSDPMFRKPPEPQRVAQEWWIYDGRVFSSNHHPRGAIHVREVLPGDVWCKRMTEADVDTIIRDYYSKRTGDAVRPAIYHFVRALGLIGEGS